MDSIVLGLRLTPHGRPAVSWDAGALSLEANLTDSCGKPSSVDLATGFYCWEWIKPVRCCRSFSRIGGEFGAHYVTALCTQPESETGRLEQIAAPSQNELERMAVAAPPMMGAE
jgi:hypothetical protein